MEIDVVTVRPGQLDGPTEPTMSMATIGPAIAQGRTRIIVAVMGLHRGLDQPAESIVIASHHAAEDCTARVGVGGGTDASRLWVAWCSSSTPWPESPRLSTL
jgi:hypothetical protein